VRDCRCDRPFSFRAGTDYTNVFSPPNSMPNSSDFQTGTVLKVSDILLLLIETLVHSIKTADNFAEAEQIYVGNGPSIKTSGQLE
jgi:hypothetical protein